MGCRIQISSRLFNLLAAVTVCLLRKMFWYYIQFCTGFTRTRSKQVTERTYLLKVQIVSVYGDNVESNRKKEGDNSHSKFVCSFSPSQSLLLSTNEYHTKIEGSRQRRYLCHMHQYEITQDYPGTGDEKPSRRMKIQYTWWLESAPQLNEESKCQKKRTEIMNRSRLPRNTRWQQELDYESRGAYSFTSKERTNCSLMMKTSSNFKSKTDAESEIEAKKFDWSSQFTSQIVC